MWNEIKTVLLLGLLSGVVLGFGYLLGGETGLTVALIFAIMFNFGMFFWSHKLVLAMYNAKPASKTEYSKLHTMVDELSRKMKLPKPALYIVPSQTPNAFATGPSPKKAVVACTQGILSVLNDHELKGVIAHELAHVKNRDMLVTTIAATLAAVISYIAQMAQFSMLFGGSRDDGPNPLTTIVLMILAPIIALILQLAISRSREFMADEHGARALKDSKGLSSALLKLENACHARPMQGNSATSSLFIVNPFKTNTLVSLFSTHPSTKARVERLNKLTF